jgi:MFS superfamily sulfate permease-like transporter
VLAAIVLVAVAALFNLSELRHLWRADRAEFTVAIAALLGVLGTGLLRGVLIGAIISLVQLLRRGSQPHVAFLGRIPGTNRFSDLKRNSENQPVPGVVIFRVESGLFYFNIEYVRQSVLNRVQSESITPKLVVCDLSASPNVDLQSAAVIRELADELEGSAIRIQAVEARSSVRDRLRGEGLDLKARRHRPFPNRSPGCGGL